MTTYGDLIAQIEILKKRAKKARSKELKEVIAGIRAKMEQYGIALSDLGGRTKRKQNDRRHKVKAKYRDPVSGQVWSGRGRTPRWLASKEAEGASREKFLV